MQKKCQKCGLIKAFSEFYTSDRSKDGYSSFCRRCKTIPTPENTITYKGLPMFKCNEWWEIYANSKVYHENGQDYIVPQSNFIIRLRLDEVNWIDVVGANHYLRKDTQS